MTPVESDQLPHRSPSVFSRAALAGLMLLLLVSTYWGGKGLELDRAVPERHRLYGIPVAVSMDIYGLEGYVAYQAVARRFFNDKRVDDILTGDLPATADGRRTPDAVEQGEGLFFIPADDKGDVTFTRIAFALFGLKLNALYNTYFVLLLGSVLAFVAAFRADSAKLFFGVCVLLSLVSMLSAFQDGLLRPHVVTFFDVRIFGLIAVLATVHVAFVCLAGPRLGVAGAAGVIYQLLLILLAIHVRSDNLLFVFVLAACAAVAALRSVRAGAASRFAWHAWPLAALAVAGGLLLTWERAAYHPKYFTSNMSHHLLWHNAGLGLALQPSLGKPLGYQISDDAMMIQVARYLLETNQPDVIAKVFGASYTNPTGTADGVQVAVGTFLNADGSDLNRYNELARQITLETVKNQPVEALSLFLYYKPRFIVAHLMWFTAFLTYDQPAIDAAGRQTPLLRAAGDTRVREIVFSPLPGSGLAVFALALTMAWPLAAREVWGALLLALSLFAFALLPSLVAYPAPFLMGSALLGMTYVLYLGLAAGVVLVASFARRVVG